MDAVTTKRAPAFLYTEGNALLILAGRESPTQLK